MILISVLIFSVVTGTVFAIMQERIENREIKIEEESWWGDDF